MNVLHMKYAVEVARTGSINKAAEVLMVAQPNLSRSIKELEADLGITIFERTRKGMSLTAEGSEFLGYANHILDHISEVEKIYKEQHVFKQKFSVCTAGDAYMSEAFVNFSRHMGDTAAELFYKEMNVSDAMKNVVLSDYKLGVVRYAADYDKYYKTMFDEKDLKYELISQFIPVVAMSKNCALAKADEIKLSELSGYTEVSGYEPYSLPSLRFEPVGENNENADRRIYVSERSSRFELLSGNEDTYMWTSSLTDEILDRYGLVQRVCPCGVKSFKDVLIYRSDHNLSELDKHFITELCLAKRKYFK